MPSDSTVSSNNLKCPGTSNIPPAGISHDKRNASIGIASTTPISPPPITMPITNATRAAHLYLLS